MQKRKFALKKKNLPKLPDSPGIYIFWIKNSPIYVGKANNLRKRVASYLAINLTLKTAKMISEADQVSYIKVASELEALLLESKLIKKFSTKYNIQLKDDKHPLYIRITKEKYPRVLTARKELEKEKNKSFFGPFPSSSQVWSVVKMLRRIFPFSDHKIGKRGCIYSQIGLCDPCPSNIEQIRDKEKYAKERQKYLQNIAFINAILSGQLDTARKSLVLKMKKSAKEKNFEEAGMIKKKVESLDYITQPITPVELFIKNPNFLEDVRAKEEKELRSILSPYLVLPKIITRIECFDIAHLSGLHPTASMVTFVNGEADKSKYRHFKISSKKGGDDVASMKEVAKRRSKYFTKWGRPDLIIVDGGKTQVNVFREGLFRYKIPIIGLAKKDESIIIPSVKQRGEYTEIKLPKGFALNLVQRLRDEAHRFARRYHHKLLQKSLIPS